MKHINRKILIAVVVVVAIVVAFPLLSNNEPEFQTFECKDVNQSFGKTLGRYIHVKKEGDGYSAVYYIYSGSKDISPIKTLALQNAFSLTNIEADNYYDEQNVYRLSVEKSKYLKKNVLDMTCLNDNANENDFYQAFEVASFIDDSKLSERIISKYKKSLVAHTEPDQSDLSERIYSELNRKKSGIKIEKSVDKKEIYNYLNEIVSSGAYFVLEDVDALTNLEACIDYLIERDDDSCNDVLESLYEEYAEEETVQKAIFCMDISFSDYADILSGINKLLQRDDKESYLYQQAQKGLIVHKGIGYDMDSPKNFAAYVTGLSLCGITPEKEQYDFLVSTYNDLVSETQEEDYTSIYYLNYVYNLWGLGEDSPDVLAEQDIDNYYYMKTLNTYSKFDNLCKSKTDIVAILSSADVSSDLANIKTILKNISIWDYKDREDFAPILNLYVSVMSKAGLLDSDLKNGIISFIKESEDDYGYESKGSYDFLTSVYYTNILYILNGGDDLGFR